MNDRPIADADLASRTPWFPVGTLPVRTGWYEARYWSEQYRKWSDTLFRYWNGRDWLFGDEGLPSDMGGHPRDQWRGKVAP